jgi:large subunit ribosomal protein L31e
MAEEKIITLNLRKVSFRYPRWERSSGCLKYLKNTLKKKFRTEKIKVDKKLNEKIWKSGSQKPPSKLRVKLTKLEDGTLKVEEA